MKLAKIIKIDGGFQFDNGMRLESYHSQDCCESHYLEFNYVNMSDVEGLEFDLSSDSFFNKIEGYGIELIPVSGFSVKIPGYGENNGYYSSSLDLVLMDSNGKTIKTYDIEECQNY